MTIAVCIARMKKPAESALDPTDCYHATAIKRTPPFTAGLVPAIFCRWSAFNSQYVFLT